MKCVVCGKELFKGYREVICDKDNSLAKCCCFKCEDTYKNELIKEFTQEHNNRLNANLNLVNTKVNKKRKLGNRKQITTVHKLKLNKVKTIKEGYYFFYSSYIDLDNTKK